MRVAVATEKCQGHGRCQTICPSLFDLDDDGFVLLIAEEVPVEELEAARSAVASCPEGAISLT